MKRFLVIAAVLLAVQARAGDWRSALAPLAAGRDEISAKLEEILKALRPRVAAESPDLLPKLDKQPPKPLPAGYGILPEVPPDEPEPPQPPQAPGERHYSIKELADAVADEKAKVIALQDRLARGEKPVAPLVDDYLARRDRRDLLDAHVKYHQAWQPQAESSPGYYQGRNALLASFRVWRSTSADAAAKQAAQRALEDGLVQFSPSPGVRLEGPSGQRVLRVPLQTDIEDESFLRAFEGGVERYWNQSAAMKEAGLRVELDWKRRSPKELYPEGPPAKGAAIDADAHMARFGPQALILTTGASATQAYPNRAIFLGPGKIGRHSLAHEFSHILGFTDGYLRAYDGSVKDPNGVVFWEVTPFPGDLLADPGAGKVSPAMARKLLEGYGAAAPPPPQPAAGTTNGSSAGTADGPPR